MGQNYGFDVIPDLVISTATTVTLAISYLGKPTRITVGGQSYSVTSPIVLNFATVGFNGLDTGTITQNTLYYIYCVKNGTTPGLVASTAAPTVGPTGYTSWKEIGRCRTLNTAATLAAIANRDGSVARQPTTERVSWVPIYSTGVRGTNIEKAFWKRNFSDLMIFYSYVQIAAGTAGSGTYAIGFPLINITPDNTKINVSAGLSPLGNAYVSSGATEYTGFVSAASSGAGLIIYVYTTISAVNPVGSGIASFASNASVQYIYNAVVPIIEWQGLYT